MNARYIIGLLLILLGLSAMTGIDIGRFIGPLFLVAFGLIMLTRRQNYSGSREAVEQDSINDVFIFSGAQRNYRSTDFNGGKIVAVFGGGDYDFAGVKTKEKIVNMELVAVFGGLRIRVPKNWVVITNAAGVIGGIDNKTNPGQKTTELRIQGAAVFGGIEIYN